MSFDPSLPEDGVNVSDTHPLREALWLGLGVIGIGVAAVVSIGLVVDFVAPRIPPAYEARLFSGWFDGDGAAPAPEPRIDGLRELLERVAAHGRDSAYPFRVRIWDSAEPNALALPGGTIAVTTGLLDAVASENELAFVLGHELGHFRNRDHLRGLGRGLGASLLLFAFGIGGAGGAAQLAAVAGQLTQRGFDRRQESAADEFALGLVVAEYGHAAGATDLFEHLARPRGANALAGYLSTHPLHADRVDHLQSIALAAGWPLVGERRSLDARLHALEVAPETAAPAR